MEWRELAAEDLYGLRNVLIIDVRSPAEFSEGRLPEAVNLPLLSNVERAEVGTIYKEQGDIRARRRALEIISPKIPGLIDDVLAYRDRSQSIVVHCWRGGLRSEAVSSVLSIAGIPNYRLSGGYKAWRNMVLRELVQDRYKFKPLVLYGLTGAGKTELLQELGGMGCQIVDLEEMANHRGSAFGGLGMGEQPSQKNFEALLWNQLRKLDLEKPVFIEAESRKVGKVSLPDSILDKILEGPAILVEGSFDARAARITEDYLRSYISEEKALRASLSMLDKIKDAVGKIRVQEIADLANQGNIAGAVRILLAEYYDPLYSRAIKKKRFEITVCSDDIKTAAGRLRDWLAQL